MSVAEIASNYVYKLPKNISNYESKRKQEAVFLLNYFLKPRPA